MQTFKNLMREARGDSVVFTFGRFNPPTTGHELLVNKLVKATSGGYTPIVFTSHSNDIKKNPLTHKQKVFYLNRFFGRKVQIADSPAKHIFDIAVYLYNQGFRNVRMVVGSDRVKEFDMLLNKYNGQEARHGMYRFDSIEVISAGERDPDAEDVSGMSASKMRQFVKDNDFDGFKEGVPSTGKNVADKLFKDLQKAMKVRPQTQVAEESELEEKPLDRAARRKKSIAMKRNAKKIARGKKKNAMKKASSDQLKKRAEKQALNKIRSKYAGEKGSNYASLSDAEKIAIDKKVEKKKKTLVPKIAKKLMKTVRSQESERLAKRRGTKEEVVHEDVSQKQINDLEKFADRLLNKFDIDIEFTRHFADRMNDSRNSPEIKISELQKFFKKIAKEKGQNIKKHGDAEAVLKDMQTDLNLPVVINFKNGEFEVVNKTIMRKKNFKTSNPEIQYESEDLEEKAFRTWAQSLARFKSKTISADKYKKVAQHVLSVMSKDGGRRGVEYYAAEVIRKFNLKGFDAHALVDVMKDMGMVKEDTKTKQDPDIDDKEGTQPARYHKGLDKDTKEKRDAHFKRGAKKDDDDPSAYKPAPGDKDAKTKPSKYTNQFKKMFGEDCWDGYKQQGMKKKGNRMVPNCVPEETFFEDTVVEDVNKSLKDKAEKSGESLSVLKKVYKRGVAAWRTGHRPGTTPEQWGLARVNAFIVKKKKGKLNHDQDLA